MSREPLSPSLRKAGILTAIVLLNVGSSGCPALALDRALLDKLMTCSVVFFREAESELYRGDLETHDLYKEYSVYTELAATGLMDTAQMQEADRKVLRKQVRASAGQAPGVRLRQYFEACTADWQVITVTSGRTLD